MSKPLITPPFVRSPYNYDRVVASDESGVNCEDPSLAQQNFKEECDINYIVDRFTRTGMLPGATSLPQFGDFTAFSGDFHSSLNQVKAAEAQFMELPASLRSRFDNDPGKLLEFVHDDKNYAEAMKLGLVPLKVLSPDDARPKGAGASAGGKTGGAPKGAPTGSPASSRGNEGDGGED